MRERKKERERERVKEEKKNKINRDYVEKKVDMCARRREYC